MTYLYVKVIGELGGSFTFIFVEIGLFFLYVTSLSKGGKTYFKNETYQTKVTWRVN